MLFWASPAPVLTAAHVNASLRRERHTVSFTAAVENGAAPLDLNRRLEDIDRDIAIRVVEEAGGNQTAAAKILGISRTTLWRLLKKD